MVGLCVLCNEEKQLTYEHVPPRAAGNNKPARLYRAIDSLRSTNRPWDFTGLSYKNAQKGTGDFYLCAKCNNGSGRWYAEAFSEMYRQTAAQHVTPFCIKSMDVSWTIRYVNIKPMNIAKQILLMVACVSGRGFLNAHPGLDKVLNEKYANPAARDVPSLRVFLNAGSLSAFYGPMAVMRGESEVMAGVNADIFGFQAKLHGSTNHQGYLDISSWVVDYEYDEEASFSLKIPCKETNTSFPEDHRSRAEIEQAIRESKAFEARQKLKFNF